MASAFGDNWQDEYYIWDCAAGTGNLLAGLTNKYNLWASDIEQGNVETMQSLIDIDDNLNLLSSHVFQFDFLNDKFNILPQSLKDIIDDPEKRKKLIIYINPPYAEVSSKDVKGKVGVNQSKIHDKYGLSLGTAGRELFAQFLTRIYFELDGCKIGEFSTLKSLTGSAFDNFRNYYMAKLLKCFIMPAYTFDNVKGNFPTGFKIWDTAEKSKFSMIVSDVYDENNIQLPNKTFFSLNKDQFINKWISEYKKLSDNPIGYMDGINGNDFQHNNIVYICNTKEQLPNPRGIWVTEKNLIEISMYFFSRHCFEHTWINHNDQFLYPNDKYKTDSEFKYNCIVYTLFHVKNAIQSKYGTNHWIPFTEQEVNAKDKFQSNFMSDFLKGKTFSPEAQAVLNSGRELWRYYHSKIANNRTASVDASFYDIREFFQHRSEKGTMNQKSDDDTYNALIKDLRQNLLVLAEKIKPKVYEYGFLVE